MSSNEHNETDNQVVPVTQTSSEVRLPNSQLPLHVLRRADVDPIAAGRAERQVSIMFLLSAVFTVLATISFFAMILLYIFPGIALWLPDVLFENK